MARLSESALRSICEMQITASDKLAKLRLYGEPLTALFGPRAQHEMREDRATSMTSATGNKKSNSNRILDATRGVMEQGVLTLDMVRRFADVSIAVISRKLQRACTVIAENAKDIGRFNRDPQHSRPCLLELIRAELLCSQGSVEAHASDAQRCGPRITRDSWRSQSVPRQTH